MFPDLSQKRYFPQFPIPGGLTLRRWKAQESDQLLCSWEVMVPVVDKWYLNKLLKFSALTDCGTGRVSQDPLLRLAQTTSFSATHSKGLGKAKVPFLFYLRAY